MPLWSVNRRRQSPSRSMTPCGFDIVPTLSTRHQWFPCGPLLATHLTWFFPGLFLLCSRPWLLTTATEGGLEQASTLDHFLQPFRRPSVHVRPGLGGAQSDLAVLIQAVDVERSDVGDAKSGVH